MSAPALGRGRRGDGRRGDRRRARHHRCGRCRLRSRCRRRLLSRRLDGRRRRSGSRSWRGRRTCDRRWLGLALADHGRRCRSDGGGRRSLRDAWRGGLRRRTGAEHQQESARVATHVHRDFGRHVEQHAHFGVRGAELEAIELGGCRREQRRVEAVGRRPGEVPPSRERPAERRVHDGHPGGRALAMDRHHSRGARHRHADGQPLVRGVRQVDRIDSPRSGGEGERGQQAHAVRSPRGFFPPPPGPLRRASAPAWFFPRCRPKQGTCPGGAEATVALSPGAACSSIQPPLHIRCPFSGHADGDRQATGQTGHKPCDWPRVSVTLEEIQCKFLLSFDKTV